MSAELKAVAATLREMRQTDVTVVAEAPRLAPHVGKMRASLARTLGVSAELVSV